MLLVLLSSGVEPDFVVGASVGALNASYFAGAPNAQGVANLERIWSGLRRSDIFPFTLASIFGLLRHPGNVVDPAGLRGVIETNRPYAQLEEALIPWYDASGPAWSVAHKHQPSPAFSGLHLQGSR
jgi:NTE family protein